jgi:hypothetical protein
MSTTKKTNTTTLSLTTIPESEVKPEPTKAEIITALATLHIQKLIEQNKELEVRREALKKKIHALMVSLVKKDGFKTLQSSASFGYRTGQSEIVRPQLEIDFPTHPDSELTKLLHKYQDCQRTCVPDLRKARKVIQARMENKVVGEMRIQQLLTDTSTRKALDSALAEMDLNSGTVE